MNLWTCFVIICIAAYVVRIEGTEWLEVRIKQGLVRGRKDPRGGLYAFYNIPYATVPLGKNKFKAPLPPPTWKKPLNAVDKGIVCPQFTFLKFIPKNVITQEDCLIANVYVPDTNPNNLPVYVVIHGGDFQFGFGNFIKMKNFMKNKDIIIVNFNYRFGIRGFLCLGTNNVPGNAGMKDQVALLRWVQENIAAFGGNPNDVTIGGYNTGSASVDLLMISKSAEGLFHKVIPESGANLAVFTMQLDPLQNAKNYAKALNFTKVDDIYALEEFYKTLPDDMLITYLEPQDSTFQFSPCVERETGDEAFLTESPLSILKRGHYKKVPLLYGFANMEGLLRRSFFEIWKDRMNKKFSDFLPGNLKFKSEDKKEQLANLVKDFYFDRNPISEKNILGYINYFTDIVSAHATLWAAKLHVEAGHKEVYLYEYSFFDDNIPVVPYTQVRGADHCAQTIAVGDGISMFSSNEDNISKSYRNIKKVIRQMWLNFIKTGKPVPAGSSLPHWPPARADGSPYMSIGQDVELRETMMKERFLFWDNIYQKYYREPKPPS